MRAYTKVARLVAVFKLSFKAFFLKKTRGKGDTRQEGAQTGCGARSGSAPESGAGGGRKKAEDGGCSGETRWNLYSEKSDRASGSRGAGGAATRRGLGAGARPQRPQRPQRGRLRARAATGAAETEREAMRARGAGRPQGQPIAHLRAGTARRSSALPPPGHLTPRPAHSPAPRPRPARPRPAPPSPSPAPPPRPRPQPGRRVSRAESTPG